MIPGPILGSAILGPVIGEVTAFDSIAWFRDLDTPPQIELTKKGHASAQVASGIIVDPFILTQPELVSIDRWQQPFSEPSQHLAPRRLETGAQQDFIYTPEWAVPIDRWLQPLSEPRRYAFEKHLPIALYPSLFSEAEFLRANFINVDRVTLHGRHTGTVELSAKHQGTIVLHGIPKGTLPEAI